MIYTKDNQSVQQLQIELNKLGKVSEYHLLDKKNLKEYQAIVHNISNLQDKDVGESIYKLCQYPIRYIRRYSSYAFVCFYDQEGVKQLVDQKQTIIGKRTAIFDFTTEQNQQIDEPQEQQEQNENNIDFNDGIEISDDNNVEIRNYNEINEESEEYEEVDEQQKEEIQNQTQIQNSSVKNIEHTQITKIQDQQDEDSTTIFLTNLPTFAPSEYIKETQNALNNKDMSHDQLVYATISHQLFTMFQIFGKIRKTVLLKNEANKLTGSGFITFKKEEDMNKCLNQYQIYKETQTSTLQLGEDNLLDQINAERNLNGFQMIEKQKMTKEQKIKNFKFELFDSKFQVFKFEKKDKQNKETKTKQNQNELLTFGLKIPGAPLFDKYKKLFTEKDIQLRQKLHQIRKNSLNNNRKINPLRVQITNLEFNQTENQILKILCRNQTINKQTIQKFYEQFGIKSFRFVHKGNKLAFELSHNFNSQGLLKTGEQRSVIKIFIEFQTVNSAKQFIQQFDTLKIGGSRIICVFAIDDLVKLHNKIEAKQGKKQ